MALLLLSCSRSNPVPEPQPQTHTIVIDGMRFEPADLTIHTGDTIVWVNKDLFPHTATAGNSTFDSQVIPAGASWKYVAKKKGEFTYWCLFHPTMKADLLVK